MNLESSEYDYYSEEEDEAEQEAEKMTDTKAKEKSTGLSKEAEQKKPSTEERRGDAAQGQSRSVRSRSRHHRGDRKRSRSSKRDRKRDRSHRRDAQPRQTQTELARGKERPSHPADPPRHGPGIRLTPRPMPGDTSGSGGKGGGRVRCPHCHKVLTDQISGQKQHMYMNVYCLRCQLWNKLPAAKQTQENWDKTREQAYQLRAKREQQDQRDAEAEVMRSTRSVARSSRRSKSSAPLPQPIPVKSPSPSDPDKESPEETVPKPRKKQARTASGRNVIINIA